MSTVKVAFITEVPSFAFINAMESKRGQDGGCGEGSSRPRAAGVFHGHLPSFPPKSLRMTLWPGRLCVMGDERQTSKQRRFNAQIQHPELTRHREETGSPAGANRKGRGRRPRPGVWGAT